MTKTLSMRLGLVCGLALLATTAAVRAEEGVAIKNILGTMGIVPRDRDAIRYRERAPLVVPPKAELRAPAAPESYASANPQWPRDPDVAAKRRSADEARRPVTASETRRMSDNNPRLTPAELQAGRIARSDPPDPKTHRGDNARDVILLSPDQLRAGRKTDDGDMASGDTTPTRRVLTEPPTAFRKPNGKSVPADFSPKVDQQALDANPMTWLTRKFTSEDDE